MIFLRKYYVILLCLIISLFSQKAISENYNPKIKEWLSLSEQANKISDEDNYSKAIQLYKSIISDVESQPLRALKN